MRSLSTTTAILLLLAAAGCAETPAHVESASSATRERPRRSEARHALRDASFGARFCVPRTTERVTVRGAFAGSTGRYAVAAIEATPALAADAERCVRESFDSAQVTPFRDEEYPIEQAFGPDGLRLARRTSEAPPPSPPPRRDTAPVARAIRLQLGAIRMCYERELRSEPSLRGRLVTHFTVEADGSFSNVHSTHEMTPTEAGDRVGACVDDVFRRGVGPVGDGPVTFSFPFNFAPGN